MRTFAAVFVKYISLVLNIEMDNWWVQFFKLWVWYVELSVQTKAPLISFSQTIISVLRIIYRVKNLEIFVLRLKISYVWTQMLFTSSLRHFIFLQNENCCLLNITFVSTIFPCLNCSSLSRYITDFFYWKCSRFFFFNSTLYSAFWLAVDSVNLSPVFCLCSVWQQHKSSTAIRSFFF